MSILQLRMSWGHSGPRQHKGLTYDSWERLVLVKPNCLFTPYWGFLGLGSLGEAHTSSISLAVLRFRAPLEGMCIDISGHIGRYWSSMETELIRLLLGVGVSGVPTWKGQEALGSVMKEITLNPKVTV